jgi:hypothetical protein
VQPEQLERRRSVQASDQDSWRKRDGYHQRLCKRKRVQGLLDRGPNVLVSIRAVVLRMRGEWCCVLLGSSSILNSIASCVPRLKVRAKRTLQSRHSHLPFQPGALVQKAITKPSALCARIITRKPSPTLACVSSRSAIATAWCEGIHQLTTDMRIYAASSLR